MTRLIVALLVAAVVAASPAAGTPTQAPKRGGTLVIRLVGPEPACLNVLQARCAEGPSLRTVAEKVLERSFTVGPDFDHRPRLVQRVVFTRKRPFTLTYHIRPEARWSDGVPVTARDFVFTLRAVRKYGGDPFERSLYAVVRTARGLDAKTLRVVLRSRTASWRELFGHVLPSHALSGRDLSSIWLDRIEDPRTGRPIGSGPFLVDSWSRGRELVLRRNPRYWGPHPAYLGRLVLRFVLTASDPSAELQRGELDVAAGVPPAAVPAVRRLAGIRVSATAGAVFEHLDFRVGTGGNPALRNKLVRRALAFGIDRVALVRQIYGDVDPSVAPLDNALLHPQSRAYEPNWRRYRYRPAEANRLLAEAGCRRGADGIHVCAGARLALRFVTSAGVPPRIRALEFLDTQLRRIGVEVEPVFAPPPVFIGQVLPSRSFDAALFSWVHFPGGSWKDVYGCGAPQNFTGYCQRLATADLDQADRILDPSQRARVLNRVDRRLALDVPIIPLYQFLVTSAHRAHVRAFALVPNNLLWNAENWWLDR